jgi:hypothetical protein
MSYTAGEIMDRAASLLNDSAKALFSYTIQLPYLNAAIDELSGMLESNNIQYTNKESTSIAVNVGDTTIGALTGPILPADLVEIQSVKERLYGSSDSYLKMERKEFLPEIEVEETLRFWAWQRQVVQLIGALTKRDVSIEYIASPLAPAVSDVSVIGLINSKNFLAFRTAALCAMYIGENPTRAAALDKDADSQMDWLLRINIKGSQVISTRRRPFMASYRSRGSW